MSVSNREKELDEFFDAVKLKLREIKLDIKHLQDYIYEGRARINNLAMTPENTHCVAHEVNNLQIETLFVMYPCMQYLQLVDKTIIKRSEYKDYIKQNEL